MRRLTWFIILCALVALCGCRAVSLPTPIAVEPTATQISPATLVPDAPVPVQPSPTAQPEPQVMPVGYPTVVPITYKMFDWGTDFGQTQPDWGPVGSIQFVTWDQINPAEGVYDWSVIDQKLALEAPLRVTLPDGSVIPKPVVIQVFPYISSSPGWSASDFYDATPEWVYSKIQSEDKDDPRPLLQGRKVGYVLQGCDRLAVLPMYDRQTWRDAYWDMVRAFGQRYNDTPQVTSVVINTGIDGETQAVKDWHCSWQDYLDQQQSAVRFAFQGFVKDTMTVYRHAFPTKPIFINNAPGGSSMRLMTAEHAASLTPPIGLKHSGMWVDLDSHQGYGTFVGSWDMIRTYSNTVPIWLESPYGLGTPEHRYWSMIAGLHYHPDAIDMHPEYFEQSDPEWLEFVVRHLGVTIYDTPSVWTVLRDTEYPLVSWGTGGVSGHMGDWAFWLYRTETPPQSVTERVWREDLPAAQDAVYSRQVRRTQQVADQIYMAFDIDDEYPFVAHKPVSIAGGNVYWTVDIMILNTGSDTFSLDYLDWQGDLISQVRTKGPELGPVNEWATVHFVLKDAYLDNNLPGGCDLRLSCQGDGDEYVHRLEVAGYWGAPPTPTATYTPGPSPTPTLVPTRAVGTVPVPVQTALLPTPEPVATAPGSLLTPTPYPGAVRFDPQVDTYLDQWEPNANWDRSPKLSARYNDVRAPLLLFDLSAIPRGAVIESAVLELCVMERTNPGLLTLSAYQVLTPWSSSDVNWNQATLSADWVSAGCNALGEDRAGLAVASVNLANEKTWYSIDIVALAQEWVNEPSANYGLVLKASGTANVQYDIYSSEHGEQALRPRLWVVWQEARLLTPTGPPATASVGTPAPQVPTPTFPPRSPQTIILQQSNTFTGFVDGYLDGWAPDVNHDGAVQLLVRQGAERVPVMRCDLSAIPPTSTIVGATLATYVLERTNAGTLTASLMRLMRPWDAGQVTWLDASEANAWEQPGARGVEADREGTVVASAEIETLFEWVAWDVTQAVQEWVSKPGDNHGLLMIANGSAVVQYALAGCGWPVEDYRPRLSITYLAATPTPMVPLVPSMTPTLSPSPVLPTLTPLPAHGTQLFQQGLLGYAGCDDAFIDQWNPQTNDSTSPALLVRPSNVRSSLLRFDLSTIPSTSYVQRARLGLYVADLIGEGATQMQVLGLVRSWVAQEVTYQRASRAHPWAGEGISEPGLDLVLRPDGGIKLPVSGDWLEIDLTDRVREWVHYPDTNQGVVLKLDGPLTSEYALASSEAEILEQRPWLWVEWVAAQPAPTLPAVETNTPLLPERTAEPTQYPAGSITPVRTIAPAHTTTPSPTVTPSNTATVAPSNSPTRTATPSPTPGEDMLILQYGLDGYQGVADTWLDRWHQEANYGRLSSVYVRGSSDQVAAIRYALDMLPSHAIIHAATLKLWPLAGEAIGGNKLQVRLIEQAWAELEASWLVARLGQPWNLAGAGALEQREAIGETRLSDELDWVSIDLTSVVRDWVAEPESNRGLLLTLNGITDASIELASSQSAIMDWRPRLEIRYTLGEPASAWSWSKWAPWLLGGGIVLLLIALLARRKH